MYFIRMINAIYSQRTWASRVPPAIIPESIVMNNENIASENEEIFTPETGLF